MRKILIAVDGSQCAAKAVEYAGLQFSELSNLRITLLHVLPYLATSLWDDGHILSRKERDERKKIADEWMDAQRKKAEPILRNAIELLVKKGIVDSQIETKTISDSSDTADSILEETRLGGYQMLLLGRCGHSAGKHFLAGSVTNKIIARGAGTAVCVVE